MVPKKKGPDQKEGYPVGAKDLEQSHHSNPTINGVLEVLIFDDCPVHFGC